MLKKFTLKKQKDIIYKEGVPKMCNPAMEEKYPEWVLFLIQKFKEKYGELTRVETAKLAERIQRRDFTQEPKS
ncbi:MAG: hypothetical protein UU10_C0010G0006 [Parcubacteria group bacterium GW2011_GWF1_40_6]|uniref:Uncharacterized protein n=2 Tax=Candidatus Nomuraibacteriota TaxID=1752729 RepID=A0A0G0QRG3_9BACT|nr:MAG: hypothetical protein UT78_C0009G0009 [Candidatus Nomurabacteria bacterium GW2011_GWF2_40_12]KKR69584.1 MAG: hypothetical protein UU10_C0010G0006 [Parcubacteria group bacterium GW2011_GWF1_40_6]OGJ09660.1 MAG: hypothetical protein A2356_03890 [Candidatus Nomurabacteria bacterium RIFOXYB1_FULL_39_16]